MTRPGGVPGSDRSSGRTRNNPRFNGHKKKNPPAFYNRRGYVSLADVVCRSNQLRVDDGYADFTRTGKTYTQFPDRSRYRVMLEDLRDDEVRKRLAAIWTAPLSLDPSKEALKVTREIGDLLATLARLRTAN